MSAPAALAPCELIGRTPLFLQGMDSQSADEICDSVRAFYRDFPAVAPWLQDVRLAEPAEFLSAPNAYALTKSQGDNWYHISFNPSYYGPGKRAELESLVASDYASRWHSYTQAPGVFEHELGHVLDLFLADRYTGTPPSYALSFNDAHSISDYAVTAGPLEAFADAFANLREGYRPGNQNVTRLVKDIIQLAQEAK